MKIKPISKKMSSDGLFIEYELDSPLYQDRIERDTVLEISYQEKIEEPNNVRVIEIREYYLLEFPRIKFVYKREISSYTLK